MHSNDKGEFVEQAVALPAWHPIRSLESVNGNEWIDLRKKFNDFMRTLQPINTLKEVATKYTLNLVQSGTLIDRAAISALTITILLEYIAGKIDKALIEVLVEAVEEWRKEIAVRGKGNMFIKRQAITRVAKFLNLDPSEIDYIIQPFLISPAINMTDIMCSVVPDPSITDTQLIYKSILKAHPFPFFERYITKTIDSVPPRTHIFMPIGDVATSANKADWMCFGVGPRSCPGQKIALCILEIFVHYLPTSPQFAPKVGHLYSGRHNDKQIPNLWYCLKTMAGAIFK